MTTFATAQDLSRRTAAARSAAVEVGHELGLSVTDAQVVHDLFSVVVHLAPSPVVARIPVVLPLTTSLDALAMRQRAELEVTGWLVAQGTPVIPPSPLVPPEPIQKNGFSMTFWEYVEEDQSKEPDYVANSGMTADLHEAMRNYPSSLSFLSAADPHDVTASLTQLEKHSDLIDSTDLDQAQEQWHFLEPLVSSQSAFEATFPGIDVQPIHGDSPPANAFSGINGDLYSDFELVTLGPVEWDMAALGPDLEAAYNGRAQQRGNRILNKEVLRFVNAVGMLRAIATLTSVPQLPQLMEFLEPAIDQWRSTPFKRSFND